MASSNINSAASTNSTLVTPKPARLHAITAFNAGAGAAYVKLYNKATAPTVGTDTPYIVMTLSATGTNTITFPVEGVHFGAGIGLGITGGAADTDTTAVAANQVKATLTFK
jgi:hypothetical protein